MECKITPDKLIDFHFGNMDLDGRTVVESHLMGCPACLQEFFLLKRDAESAHAVALRPAATVRQRISREFAAFSHQNWITARPKKLIFGGLVAAAAAAFLLFFHKAEVPKLDTAPKAEMVRSLDETVDSGGSAPGHINII